MPKTISQRNAIRAARESVLDATKRLYWRGLNSTLSGNVSARVGGMPDFMAITPSALDKPRIAAAQIPLMKISTQTVLEGPKQSSEFQVHTHIYEAMPKVNAVVHPHPQYSLAMVTALGRQAIRKLEANAEEFDYYVGAVGIVKGSAGTKGLAKAVASEVAKGCRVVIMEDHGTVGTGNTMQEALGSVEELELMAKKYFISKMLKHTK